MEVGWSHPSETDGSITKAQISRNNIFSFVSQFRHLDHQVCMEKPGVSEAVCSQQYLTLSFYFTDRNVVMEDTIIGLPQFHPRRAGDGRLWG